jgi:hypothetical protein
MVLWSRLPRDAAKSDDVEGWKTRNFQPAADKSASQASTRLPHAPTALQLEPVQIFTFHLGTRLPGQIYGAYSLVRLQTRFLVCQQKRLVRQAKSMLSFQMLPVLIEVGSDSGRSHYRN